MTDTPELPKLPKTISGILLVAGVHIDDVQAYGLACYEAGRGDAHASALRDAARFRLLAAEAYECVIPHGNILDGMRTAWITKLHSGKSFEEAIDRALDDNTKGAAE